MVTLTFTISATGYENEVTGTIVSRNPPVLEESHQNRPNWRIEDDGSVTLLSANTDAEIEDFGENAAFPDYCLAHGTGYPTGYDHCPICREESRIEQMEQEMHARRADPSMHPSVDAPRY